MVNREEKLDVLLAVAEDVGRFKAQLAQAERAHQLSSHRRRSAQFVRVAQEKLESSMITLERVRANFLATEAAP